MTWRGELMIKVALKAGVIAGILSAVIQVASLVLVPFGLSVLIVMSITGNWQAEESRSALCYTILGCCIAQTMPFVGAGSLAAGWLPPHKMDVAARAGAVAGAIAGVISGTISAILTVLSPFSHTSIDHNGFEGAVVTGGACCSNIVTAIVLGVIGAMVFTAIKKK
jgi:hypothetical protein